MERTVRVALLTSTTLVAFAANSLLCRMALGAGSIDPVSFTTVRLVSGAAALVAVSRFTGQRRTSGGGAGSWASATALFAYALAFSLAYVSLDTGTGALILFGSVQVTMIGSGLASGERPHVWEWTGLAAALAGLVYLVSPGLSAPDPLGAGLMALAGVAWGVYSLRGRGAAAPVPATGGNFARSVPLGLLASVAAVSSLHAEVRGVLLAALSGAVTSGLGYVLWYMALRGLTSTRAALVQLAVPVLAAVAGVVFLAEQPSLRLALASALILGGIALGVVTRR